MSLLSRRRSMGSGGAPAHSAAQSKFNKAKSNNAVKAEDVEKENDEIEVAAVNDDMDFTAPSIPSSDETEAKSSGLIDIDESLAVGDITTVNESGLSSVKLGTSEDGKKPIFAINENHAGPDEAGSIGVFGTFTNSKEFTKIPINWVPEVYNDIAEYFQGSTNLILNGVIVAGLSSLKDSGKNLIVSEFTNADEQQVVEIIESAGNGCVYAAGFTDGVRAGKIKTARIPFHPEVVEMLKWTTESGRRRLAGNRSLCINGLVKWYLEKIKKEGKQVIVNYRK